MCSLYFQQLQYLSSCGFSCRRPLQMRLIFPGRRPLLDDDDNEVLVVRHNQFLPACLDPQILEVIVRIQIPGHVLGALRELWHALRGAYKIPSRKELSDVLTRVCNVPRWNRCLHSPGRSSRQFLSKWLASGEAWSHRGCRWHTWQWRVAESVGRQELQCEIPGGKKRSNANFFWITHPSTPVRPLMHTKASSTADYK